MMWQVKITVLNADTLHTIRIRHTNILHRADMVLVHCEGNHYIPAVRRVVNEGVATDDVDVLKVRALILSEGYNLQSEQPEVFDDHMDPDKFDTIRGMSRLLGNTMSLLVFALVFALAELHNMSQGSSHASAAAASSSGMCFCS